MTLGEGMEERDPFSMHTDGGMSMWAHSEKVAIYKQEKEISSEPTLPPLPLTPSLHNWKYSSVFWAIWSTVFCYGSLSRLKHVPLVIPEFYLTCAPKELNRLNEGCN